MENFSATRKTYTGHAAPVVLIINSLYGNYKAGTLFEAFPENKIDSSMEAGLYKYREGHWLKHDAHQLHHPKEAGLVLCFGNRHCLADPQVYTTARKEFPKAAIASCSTAGEIFHEQVLDGTVVAAALQFDHTSLVACRVNVSAFDNTYTAAIALARQLPEKDLQYVLVLSDGSKVNGSDLTKGLASQLDKKVLITGGLAGDGAAFENTLVGLNAPPGEGEIVAIGFYGDRLTVTHGSQGGWDIFGLEKTVTNASGNILMELENQNALDLYKKYLGPESANLPGSALLFPLSVKLPGSKKPVVRTILSINEADRSMTFAGDIPEGSKVRFMKANFERLKAAASEAANHTLRQEQPPGFSLLISCVGRKLVLQEQTHEEVKAVAESFAKQTPMAGFYSYGELSPFNDGGKCQLHNQTMTITSFYES